MLSNHPALLLPDSAIDLAIAGADRILREVGVQLLDDAESIDQLHGAAIDVRPGRGAIVGEPTDDGSGARARSSVGALLDIVSSAPRTFVQHARNPARSVQVGGPTPICAPVYGPPNVIDDNGIRRPATMADYEELVRIADASPGLANTGHMMCVPHDVDEPERYLAMARAHLTCSDKPFLGSTASEQSTTDVIELTAHTLAAAGNPLSAGSCALMHLCNSIPPLTWRGRMLGVLRASAVAGQGSLVTSFQMMGATGPAAVLGVLSQGLAESLVGLALTQLYRAGAPAVLGVYAVPFDMRTMQPRFGDPNAALVQAGAVQLARRIGVPALGYGGLTSSKVDDAQAGAESALATRASIDSGADFIIHAAGWLDNGRTVGFSKYRREAAALGC
ncbi:MAG: putative rane protein [Ilumatobacteraceae bacterium]|nr:putative rane protein [Ilumatobacteraceae bacterium]